MSDSLIRSKYSNSNSNNSNNNNNKNNSNSNNNTTMEKGNRATLSLSFMKGEEDIIGTERKTNEESFLTSKFCCAIQDGSKINF